MATSKFGSFRLDAIGNVGKAQEGEFPQSEQSLSLAGGTSYGHYHSWRTCTLSFQPGCQVSGAQRMQCATS